MLLVVFRRGRQPRCAHVLPDVFCGRQHFLCWPWFLCSRAPWLTFHLRCRVRHARSSLGVAQNPDVAECGFWRRNISAKMDASQTLLSRRSHTALAEVVIKAESPSIAWSLLLAAVPLVERRLSQNHYAPFPWSSPLHSVHLNW